MGIRHAYQTASADDPGSEVSANEWNADHEVSDFIPLPNIAVPSAPGSGMRLYSRARAGRSILEIIGPSGIDTGLQPALFGNSISLWLPGTGTTAAINFGASWTVSATQAHPAIASTNLMSAMRRATYTTSTTSGNAAGIRSGVPITLRGNAAGMGGWFYFSRFGVVTLQSAMQIWNGLSASNALLAGEPSAQANTVCVGKDTGDTNWQLIFRDGSAATKVDLGVAVAANDILDFTMFAPPNGSNVTCRVVRVNDGTVLANNTVHTANLPTSTSVLYAHAETRTNAAAACAIGLSRIYVETDL